MFECQLWLCCMITVNAAAVADVAPRAVAINVFAAVAVDIV